VVVGFVVVCCFCHLLVLVVLLLVEIEVQLHHSYRLMVLVVDPQLCLYRLHFLVVVFFLSIALVGVEEDWACLS